MHKTRFALVIGGALFAATSVAGAQLRDNVPPGQMPSAGMCRVWIDGVPAGRQPAQTDCNTARRTAPANARILYGATASGVQTDPRKVQQGRGRGQVIGTGTGGTYDPRRSTDGRYDPNGQYSVMQRERQRAEWERQQAANERERLAREQRKYDKKQQKERDKGWKKSQKKDHGDRNDDHGDGNDDHGNGNDDHRGRGSNGQDGQHGRNDERQNRRVEAGSGTVFGNPRTGASTGDPRKNP
jgi:transcription termination factor Rho